MEIMILQKNILWKLLVVLGLFMTPIQVSAQQSTRNHTVVAGETIYAISRQYGVSVDELFRLNPVAKDGIRAGEVIKIPNTKPTQQTVSGPVYHKVEAGETLYSISRKYGISPNAILEANKSINNADKLSEGIIIVIPDTQNDHFVVKEKGTVPSSSKTPQKVTGLKTYKVPSGATIYSLLQVTGWSEEEFYHYNPQVRNGLKADATILIPDASIPNNLAMGSRKAFPTGAGYTVVLALPFSNDKGQRFAKYYEGFLIALLEAKEAGKSIHLYAVDSNDSDMGETSALLNGLPKIDMILGGVSDNSISKLSEIAKSKGAIYVVPFTSKDYTDVALSGVTLYQVNTPHQALYEETARKFVSEFKGAVVQFVKFPGDSNNKDAFVSTLKRELDRVHIPYKEIDQSGFRDIGVVQSLSMNNPKTIVVPDAGSVTAANNILTTIALAQDSLGISNVTVFGYPEWQTYGNSISQKLKKVEGTFYTTFFAEPESATYKEFESAFKGWYGHGLGTTYPRYSLLGYDTGRYFLNLVGNNAGQPKVWRGIQSKFEFEQSPRTSGLRSNLGVLFVQYRNAREARRY